MTRKALFAATIAAAAAATPVLAHHSYAMFDRDQYRTLVGTVKAYNHVNPHGYLDLLIPAKSGRVQEWSVESPSVGVMQRVQVTPESFKPGDHVTVVIHPLRNGTTGGDFVSAILANGVKVGPVERGKIQ